MGREISGWQWFLGREDCQEEIVLNLQAAFSLYEALESAGRRRRGRYMGENLQGSVTRLGEYMPPARLRCCCAFLRYRLGVGRAGSTGWRQWTRETSVSISPVTSVSR